MGVMFLALCSESASAGETGYRIGYDYPGHPSDWYGHEGSLFEQWQDFGSLSSIQSQQGTDFPQSYLADAVGFDQGPPVARSRNAHSLYEFRFGLVNSCVESVTFPCSSDLFSDRFELP